jgi:hypothetical protein
VSHPTLPPDRPRRAASTVRAVQAGLAVLGLAVLAWTAVARPAPDPHRMRAGPVLVVTGTTLAPAGYTPTPAGPPCPASDQPRGVGR